VSAVVKTRPPCHLWFVGSFFDDTQVAYFTDYPMVPAIFWTIAVWGA
jgi:hypothetical protein